MNGAPAKIHSIDGTNVTQVVIAAPMTPAAIGENGAASRKAARKPTNCVTRISGPGVVSARPRPSTISGARHPVMGLDRLLRHVGQHRIGAAEAHHRELGKEHADADQHMVRRRASARPARPAPTTATRPMTAASANCRHGLPPDVSTISTLPDSPSRSGAVRATTYPISAAAPTISGKRQRQKENADERQRRQRDQQLGLERALADAPAAPRSRSPARRP